MSLPQDPHLPQLQKGLALQREGQLASAEAVYKAVLQLAPQNPMAWHLLGTVAGQLGDKVAAVTHLQQSLRLYPGDPIAWKNLASAFLDIGEYSNARGAAERALGLRPDYHGARWVWAIASSALNMYVDALDTFRTLIAAKFYTPEIWSSMWRAASALCDWDTCQAAEIEIRKSIDENRMVLMAFDALAFSDDPKLHLEIARSKANTFRRSEQLSFVERVECTAKRIDGLIRIAYLSADFQEHATAYLMAELFERHDKNRFEIIGVSFGPDGKTAMRRRLQSAFSQFWEVRSVGDKDLAVRMIEYGVDIAIDLKGYTRDSRPGLFHFKPAPVIVSYLGYPGTMGSSVYDYVVGDSIVTPREMSKYYDERLVQMPWSYQVNDGLRLIDSEIPSRKSLGLPEVGVVFAAFNSVYKITPIFFQIWMRLLMAVPGSVLWLITASEEAQSNLRKAAVIEGVDPARLVFAHSIPLPQHLARHAHADLLLDNLPYNAHTTTSDALWAGVPVVTCMGQAFAGRVAASLLHAVGLPELVTHSLPEYEALALRLAKQPQELQRLRAHLKAVRSTAPLFDTERFTRQLESAYVHMHERRLQGLPPEGFAVLETPGAAMLPLRSVPPSLQPVPPLSS